jgi:hypothetical protein
MQKITVTIDADANVRVEVNGVTGKACHALTADLERALGKVREVENKADYHKAPTVGQQQKAGQ